MEKHKINYGSVLKIRKLLFFKYASDVIASLINIIFPVIIGKMIEAIFYGADIKLFAIWGAAYTAAFLFKQLFHIITNTLNIRMQKSFTMKLKSLLYEKVISSHGESLESLASGDTIHTLTRDGDQVSKFYNESLGNILNSVVQMAGIVLIMSYYHAGLAMIILSFSIAVVFSSNASKKRFGKMRISYRTKLGGYLGWTTEHLAGMEDIRMNQAEGQIENAFSRKTESILKDKEKLRFAEIKAERIDGLLSSVFTVIFWAVSAFMIIGNSLTVGLFYMIHQYFTMLIHHLDQINQERTNLHSYYPSFMKLEACLKLPGETISDTGCMPNHPLINKTISLDKVSFSYGEKAVLNQVSCSLDSGKITVIVGENGEGKTTILNLLMHFYTPGEGTIKIGDQPIEDIPVLFLREQIGYVQQNSIIFSGTLRENMKLYHPSCSDADIWDSLQIFGMKQTVESWEKQLDTDLNSGERLSGGQKQRIALARIFLKNPSIVLMDEPTASLDYETEKQILEDIRRIFKEKLVLMVSHRGEVVKSADYILVMRRGRIIAEGKHQDLISDCSYYAELFRSGRCAL